MVYPLILSFLLMILLFFPLFMTKYLNKQAQEVIFSKKLEKVCQPPLRFNNNCVSQASSQKHLG